MPIPKIFDGRAISSMAKATLKGGIVARLNMTLWVAIIGLTVLGVASRNPYLQAGSGVGILLLVFQLGNRIINYAQKNPGAALLDGVEYVEHYKQVQMANKNDGGVVTPASQDRIESGSSESEDDVVDVDVIPAQPDPVERRSSDGETKDAE